MSISIQDFLRANSDLICTFICIFIVGRVAYLLEENLGNLKPGMSVSGLLFGTVRAHGENEHCENNYSAVSI